MLAVDPGERRVGFAISDPDRKFAFPLKQLERSTPARDEAFLKALVAEEEPVLLVVGLPLVAAEPRIEAAVLGLCGISGPSASRLALDAPKVTVPVQMLLQWDDELFSRESVFDLFGLIAAEDRRLIAGPGRHAAVSIETFVGTADFLADRLGRRG